METGYHKFKTKEKIDELALQNKRLEIINLVAKSINVQMGYSEIIDQVAKPLHEVIEYDLLSFCLIEGDSLVIKSGVPRSQEILGEGTVLKRDNSAPWVAVTQRRCFLRQDIWNECHKYQEDDALYQVGVRSAIMAPLFLKNNVIGSLNLGSKKSYAYSEDDFYFVQQLADQLAVCIQNLHLYSEVYKGKREWEETFKAVQDHILLLDSQYKILRVNNIYNGMEPESLVGKLCAEIFPFCSKDCSECLLKRTFLSGREDFEEIKSNNRILNIYTYPVFNETGEVYSVVIYIKDVTEKKKIEVQLFQSAKLAAVGEMAAGTAHELNNPLTSIIGNANLLLRKMNPSDKSYHLLEDIKNSGTRCKNIVQNLLTFSRQNSYTFTQVLLEEVIDNSLSLIRYQLEKNNIVIEKNLSENLPVISGNQQQLEQVVINLLLNAKDALEESTEKKITVGGHLEHLSDRSNLVIFISDTGPGIPPDTLDKIFDPFFTTKTTSKGTGLGLSVSLGIAESHCGTIKVHSEPGSGSTFYLTIPIDSCSGKGCFHGEA